MIKLLLFSILCSGKCRHYDSGTVITSSKDEFQHGERVICLLTQCRILMSDAGDYAGLLVTMSKKKEDVTATSENDMLYQKRCHLDSEKHKM